MSLIGNSELIIWDEPTKGLDHESKSKVAEIALGMGRKKTLLIST
jgi:ABC-type multidrug transport system ATPase subunit